MRIITCGRKVRGTCHADELSYLFYNAGAKKLKCRTAEYATIRRMVAILAKFAECGDPNIPLTETAVNWTEPAGTTSGKLNGTGSGSASASDTPTTGISSESESSQQEPDSELPHHTTTGDKTVDDDDGTQACVNNDGNTNVPEQHDEYAHDLVQTHLSYWPPITAPCNRVVGIEGEGAVRCDDSGYTFKCLNISDELEVIDLPETEKLKLWDSMYEDKSLLY